MMKHTQSTILTIATLAIIALCLSACGRRNQDNDSYYEETETGTGVVGIHHTPDVETFTIFTSIIELSWLQDSAEALQQTLLEQGIHVQFEFEYYHFAGDWHEGLRRQSNLLHSKFAAGAGPDIFFRDFMLLYPFIENGFIADIYTVIDQSTYFDRDDFFSNVLEGLEVNGRLYALPLVFGVDFIGINANAPQSFISRFEALDRVSLSDITSMYLDLVEAYPQWSEYALIHGWQPQGQQLFAPEFTNVIDFAGRTVYLSPVAHLLDNMRFAFAGNRLFGTPPVNWRESPQEDLTVIQERYVFSVAGVGDMGVAALFEFRDPKFVNFIPFADDSGRLVNRRWSQELVVNPTANPDLVMAFYSQIMSDHVADIHRTGHNIPMLKRYFHDSLEISFTNSYMQMNLPPMLESPGFASQLAIARLEGYSAWPSVALLDRVLPPRIMFDLIEEFIDSDTPIDEAITQLEADITAWFYEERGEVEELNEGQDIYEPDGFYMRELPARVLTIRTRDCHTAVIRQAAEAMNRDWFARDIQYVFHVEIEEHRRGAGRNVDPEYNGGHALRLRTELMAGQGPDMFIMDPNWFHGGFFDRTAELDAGSLLDIHVLAASGFLRDIYTLMDADPNTNRDEFFTQPLQAFEINNGLYVFPTSFGFEYIGINARVPQSFIDRFTQKSTVSLSEMMALYLELIETNSEDFGHFTFNDTTRISQPCHLLQTIIGEFIDFNTRTSNLTDPRFVEALEYKSRITNWYGHSSGWRFFSTADTLREHARGSLFINQSFMLHNFDAFFDAETPIFMHHIPLSDDYGRLMLSPPGNFTQVWAGIMITATGDGELAWELTRHMIYAYTNPAAGKTVLPRSFVPAPWGRNSLATPILRSLFRDHTMRSFEEIFDELGTDDDSDNIWAQRLQTFVGFDDSVNRTHQFENAINRIAAYNEMPMGLLMPMIPGNLFREPYEQFMLGLIDAETAAQRMHNTISLWLIE